jgi:hypothetical protein
MTLQLNLRLRSARIASVLAIFVGAGLSIVPAAHATIFTDQAMFTAAATADGIGLTVDQFTADGAIGTKVGNPGTLGAFTYTYPAGNEPGIASDGMGGQALGDLTLGTDPNAGTGVFAGGSALKWTKTTGSLLAFGAIFSFAPSFDPLVGGMYSLKLDDGGEAGTVANNPDGQDASIGGTFFLGFIVPAADAFTAIDLASLTDAVNANTVDVLTPAFQINELDFATVPEPSSLGLVAAGLVSLTFLRRRFVRRTGSSVTKTS